MVPWNEETGKIDSTKKDKRTKQDVPLALWLLLGLPGANEGVLYSNANCCIRNVAVVATRLQIAAMATTRSIIKARRALSVVLNPSTVHHFTFMTQSAATSFFIIVITIRQR